MEEMSEFEIIVQTQKEFIEFLTKGERRVLFSKTINQMGMIARVRVILVRTIIHHSVNPGSPIELSLQKEGKQFKLIIQSAKQISLLKEDLFTVSAENDQTWIFASLGQEKEIGHAQKTLC